MDYYKIDEERYEDSREGHMDQLEKDNLAGVEREEERQKEDNRI